MIFFDGFLIVVCGKMLCEYINHRNRGQLVSFLQMKNIYFNNRVLFYYGWHRV